MKQPDNIVRLIEKYRLNFRVPFRMKRGILRAKRTTLSRILVSENPGITGIGAAVRFKYALDQLGLRVSLANGLRAAYTLYASAACAIIAVTLCVLIPRVSVTHDTGGESRGFFISHNGDVRVTRKGKTVDSPEYGAGISDGYRIGTEESSSALVRRGDDYIGFLERTTCGFELTPGITRLKIGQGEIFVRVGKISGSDIFEVTTPHAVIRVCGTLFDVRCDGRRTVVSVGEGTVLVTRIATGAGKRAGPGECVVVGDTVSIRPVDATESLILRSAGAMTIQGDEKQRGEDSDVIQDTLRNMNELRRRKPAAAEMTPDSIRKAYGRLDMVTLYDGRIYTGALSSKEGYVTITTVKGIVTVRKKDIKRIRVARSPDQGKGKMTLERIKTEYGVVEEILLYDGKIYRGATVSLGETVTFMTINGAIQIPAKKIRGKKTIEHSTNE